MRPITRDDVGSVLRDLIRRTGETTTLDVKRVLRSQRLWATQSEVSEYVWDIILKDGDIQYTDNGIYRVYTFVPAPSNTDELTDTTSITVIVQNPDNIPATYKVAHAGGGFERTYQNVTRGQAKYQWRRETGFPYQDARTKKVVFTQ